MNTLILTGRLTKDPETRQAGNSTLSKLSIAVDRRYKTEGQPDADFFNVSVWGKQAENCGKYLVKGQAVAVHGRIQNRTYIDKEGVKRYATDIIADDVEFGAKPQGASHSGGGGGGSYNNRQGGTTADDLFDDDDYVDDFEPLEDAKLPF